MRTLALALLVIGSASAGAAPNVAAETRLERGEYLVHAVAACGNCHTPIEADGTPARSRELSGRFVITTPGFDAYAPNISPDPATGIGNWTDAQIAKAIREGVRPTGAIIGPPMPIDLYRQLSDTDVDAIVAYLRTVTPVTNTVPKSVYRIALPRSYGPPVGHVPDVPAGVTVEYGAYLAGPVAHCIECHSTPGPTGRPDWETTLGAGGMAFAGPWGISVAPNITPHADGVRDLSDADLATIITTGTRPDGSKMVPPMGFSYYAQMRPDDVAAIILYLRSIPPLPTR